MRKLSTVAKRVGALIIGIVYGAAISIFPLALINHKHPDLLFTGLNWQQKSFVAICVATIALIYMIRSFSDQKEGKFWQRPNLLSILVVVYLCCYTTCAALCQKGNITAINLPGMPADADMNGGLFSAADCSTIASIGLGLVIIAAIMQVTGKRTDRLDWSWLLFMAGIPLIFSVWLPLVALPGIFIVLKWVARQTGKAIIN